ncbi:predicted protein [Brucella abortus bv. 4 str. 292]|uniref:Uncharacterized protein n=7 Tax=Brucella TaxID=234 RepID=Q2YJR8_BRUA2|nr:hypothetical protein BRA1016 [Brucella suis 1330]AAX76338.1 hypothetical conserved protein [Brucella abortus bv. 1 str. 9-941]ABX64179.1 Hypothetical protein, conserved [Brucella canis ATCC 23365]ABY39963.1 Hypothetical protein, conserved [Brucella suis ATCC 23445]ACU50122.1 hypothetical protein BMI_II1009 [Brucella microti CCM 4915]AEK56475.1 hypothetical protein BPI_II1071 [Brucella pinnipedialis B2/94]AEU08132.1 hypothetical protein BSVBI22_B1007 [Brucella suis VBI22]AEW16141.1 hypothe
MEKKNSPNNIIVRGLPSNGARSGKAAEPLEDRRRYSGRFLVFMRNLHT